jgi:hypothetical protein
LTAVDLGRTLEPVVGPREKDLPSEREIDELQELADLLEVIEVLRDHLERRPGIDTASTEAELDRLAVRLRESQARLSARKPVDIRSIRPGRSRTG